LVQVDVLDEHDAGDITESAAYVVQDAPLATVPQADDEQLVGAAGEHDAYTVPDQEPSEQLIDVLGDGQDSPYGTELTEYPRHVPPWAVIGQAEVAGQLGCVTEHEPYCWGAVFQNPFEQVDVVLAQDAGDTTEDAGYVSQDAPLATVPQADDEHGYEHDPSSMVAKAL
jgi:hypothetical protein